jgi:hypothetical protein
MHAAEAHNWLDVIGDHDRSSDNDDNVKPSLLTAIVNSQKQQQQQQQQQSSTSASSIGPTADSSQQPSQQSVTKPPATQSINLQNRVKAIIKNETSKAVCTQAESVNVPSTAATVSEGRDSAGAADSDAPVIIGWMIAECIRWNCIQIPLHIDEAFKANSRSSSQSERLQQFLDAMQQPQHQSGQRASAGDASGEGKQIARIFCHMQVLAVLNSKKSFLEKGEQLRVFVELSEKGLRATKAEALQRVIS